MDSDEGPSAPPALELLPGNKPSEVGRGKHSAYELVANRTALYKEYIIAVEEIKLMQSALKQCVQKHGVNAAEECSEMRDRLWEKINTPNYGAPGPPQGSSRYMAKPRRSAEA